MREAPVKTTGFRQGITSTSTTAKERLGCLRILEDGRKFRYSKSGGALSAGDASVAVGIDSNHITGAVAALNSSSTQVQVTVTAGTAIASNALAGGYVHAESGLGAGRTYRIESNTALTAAGTSITLALTDRMATSDGTTKVALVHNRNSGVVVGGVAGDFAGVAPVDVAIDKYFWAQTGGPSLALISGTPAVGVPLTLGATGSLAAIVILDTSAVPSIEVATMAGTVGVDAEYKPVMLTSD